VEAGRNLGLALIRSGRHREAAALLERLLDQNPTDTVLLFGLGAARFIAALEAYRPEMRPQDRQALYSEMYRAFRLFEAALTKEQAPSRELHHNIALYHYIRREFDPAEKRFLEALKLGEDAQTHFCVGVVRADYAVQLRKEHEAPVEELPPQARDKLRQALQSFEAAVVLAPESCDAVCNLGMAAYQLGEFETSVKAFRRLAHHERSAEAYNALALVHAKRAKWLQLQAKAVSLASEAKRTIMVREARKLLNVATNCFKEAVHRDNRNPILHSNIGLAYLFRNEGDDVQSALAHWQMMRRVGGAWGERQYAILSEMVEAKEHAKAEYNDTELAYRPIDPRGAVLSISPVPAGPIQVFDDCYDETDWQIVSDDPLLQKALARRLRLRALEARRQALSV
jgi:tetratricopeptide (TPR) repeat protein